MTARPTLGKTQRRTQPWSAVGDGQRLLAVAFLLKTMCHDGDDLTRRLRLHVRFLGTESFQGFRLQIVPGCARILFADGKEDVALTDNIGVNWAPYWHPSEPYIIWCGADHSDPKARPNYDLWLMKFAVKDGKFTGGPQTRITDHPSADVLPVFSPDGKRLMWTSKRGKGKSSQLWMADFMLPAD